MQTAIVLKRQLPELRSELEKLSDTRKNPHYTTGDLAMAVIVMFLFKRGSRNNADNSASKLHYRQNIERIFEMKLPDLDTANDLMKKLQPAELEQVKQKMVSRLIANKTLNKFRLEGLYHNVTVDATGVHTYYEEPYPECPYKSYKSGKKIWLAQVLEAKIVCANGFSISIATEWIKNPADESFIKQDCEQKAFVRLAQKLKASFPRLPMCITADGLYPNNTIFNICEENDWKFIITLKDGNLKSVWKDITFLNLIECYQKQDIVKQVSSKSIKETYRGYKDIHYKDHRLAVVEAELLTEVPNSKGENTIEQQRFVHITNLKSTKENLLLISESGRMRWKIENEGFNEQKNTSYNLQHKYSRKSFNATQNYYQCLQLAHMINQLAYKSKKIDKWVQAKDTMKSVLEVNIAILLVEELTPECLAEVFKNNKCQFRY